MQFSTGAPRTVRSFSAIACSILRVFRKVMSDILRHFATAIFSCPPVVWSIFALLGWFWSVLGPRGSVCRHTEAFDTASTRRIHPRSPEASDFDFLHFLEKSCAPGTTQWICPPIFDLFLRNMVLLGPHNEFVGRFLIFLLRNMVLLGPHYEFVRRILSFFLKYGAPGATQWIRGSIFDLF